MGVARGAPPHTHLVAAVHTGVQEGHTAPGLDLPPLLHGKAKVCQKKWKHFCSWSLQVWSPPAGWSTASRRTTILSTLESLKTSLTVLAETSLCLTTRQFTSRTSLTTARLPTSSGPMGSLSRTSPGMT